MGKIFSRRFGGGDMNFKAVTYLILKLLALNMNLQYEIILYKLLTILLLGGYRTSPPLADLAVISKGMYQTTPNFLNFFNQNLHSPIEKSFFMIFTFSFKKK